MNGHNLFVITDFTVDEALRGNSLWKAVYDGAQICKVCGAQDGLLERKTCSEQQAAKKKQEYEHFVDPHNYQASWR